MTVKTTTLTNPNGPETQDVRVVMTTTTTTVTNAHGHDGGSGSSDKDKDMDEVAVVSPSTKRCRRTCDDDDDNNVAQEQQQQQVATDSTLERDAKRMRQQAPQESTTPMEQVPVNQTCLLQLQQLQQPGVLSWPHNGEQRLGAPASSYDHNNNTLQVLSSPCSKRDDTQINNNSSSQHSHSSSSNSSQGRRLEEQTAACVASSSHKISTRSGGKVSAEQQQQQQVPLSLLRWPQEEDGDAVVQQQQVEGHSNNSSSSSSYINCPTRENDRQTENKTHSRMTVNPNVTTKTCTNQNHVDPTTTTTVRMKPARNCNGDKGHSYHTSQQQQPRKSDVWKKRIICLLGLLGALLNTPPCLLLPPWQIKNTHALRLHPHIIPPKHVTLQQLQDYHHQQQHGTTATGTRKESPAFLAHNNWTLRNVLTHPDGYHLAMAPAFFGFYGYFGVLAAWDELTVLTTPLPTINNNNTDPVQNEHFQGDRDGTQVLESPASAAAAEVGTVKSAVSPGHIRSVAGASAGAMAAVLLAAGITPRRAATYVTSPPMTSVRNFADFPGLLALFRGHKFEQIMQDFIQSENSLPNNNTTTSCDSKPLQLQDAAIPVAVSAFDLRTLSGKILESGSMARAARASATFPFLFQPVPWRTTSDSSDNNNNENDSLWLIDGGITDFAGMNGLTKTIPKTTTTTAHHHDNGHEARPVVVVNLSIGDFLGTPPGPSSLPGNPTVLSISVQHLPMCGPWAMENGPLAVEAAFRAMQQSLDIPLYRSSSNEENHYELHIDASAFASVQPMTTMTTTAKSKSD